MLVSLLGQQSLRLVKDLSDKDGPRVYTVDPKTDSKRVVEVARYQRTGLLLIDLGNFTLNESLGKKIPQGARGHIKAQPYDNYAFAVSRAASTGAMAGSQLNSTERVMGLSPSDAASICGGPCPTVMLISSEQREHFGGPHVPDREFWKERGGDEWRRVLRQARNTVDLGDRSVHIWDIRGWKNIVQHHGGRHHSAALPLGRLRRQRRHRTYWCVRCCDSFRFPYCGRPFWLSSSNTMRPVCFEPLGDQRLAAPQLRRAQLKQRFCSTSKHWAAEAWPVPARIASPSQKQVPMSIILRALYLLPTASAISSK